MINYILFGLCFVFAIINERLIPKGQQYLFGFVCGSALTSVFSILLI